MMNDPGVLPGAFGVAPIARIGPSRFRGLKSCRLREIWVSNRMPTLLPMNARMHIGTIIHEVLAAAGRGELSCETDVESYWANAVNITEREMLGSWLERSLVPLSKSVRSYAVDELRAINKAREIALCARPPVTAFSGVTGYGFELWVHTPDEKICGYIDHAYKDEAGIVIRDYKSGYVSEFTDEHVVKEAFAVQLHLYAALYNFTFKQWPRRLELTPTGGVSVLVPFDPAQCISLVSEAKSLLDNINALVLRINEEHLSPATLASPSPETCRHCAYRPNCSAYVRFEKTPDAGWPFDVWGVVKNVKRLMNGQLALILETSNGTEVIRGFSPERDHPALASITAGERLAIFNVQKSFPDGGLKEGLYTTIYRYTR